MIDNVGKNLWNVDLREYWKMIDLFCFYWLFNGLWLGFVEKKKTLLYLIGSK